MARQDSLICVARTETRDIQGLASFGLLAWRYIRWIYCRHLELHTPSGIWRCRSGHLLPARRCTCILHSSYKGTGRGSTLYIAHRTCTDGIYIVLKNFQGFFPVDDQVRSMQQPHTVDSSKQPTKNESNPAASPCTSDDQFYGGALRDFLFVCSKDIAFSRIPFFFLFFFSHYANLYRRGPNHYQIIGQEL